MKSNAFQQLKNIFFLENHNEVLLFCQLKTMYQKFASKSKPHTFLQTHIVGGLIGWASLEPSLLWSGFGPWVLVLESGLDLKFGPALD